MQEFINKLSELIYIEEEQSIINFEEFYNLVKEYAVSFQEYELVVLYLLEKEISFEDRNKIINPKHVIYKKNLDLYIDTEFYRSYRRQIESIEVLNHEESNELVTRAKLGDRDSLDVLTISNLRMVRNLAERYSVTGYDINDLIQDGNEGLLHAIMKFKPELGYEFSTYAMTVIRGYMLNGVSNWNEVPRCYYWKAERIKRTQQQLLEEKGKADICEIANILDMTEKQVEQRLKDLKTLISMEDISPVEEGFSYLLKDDLYNVESKLEKETLLAFIQEYFKKQFGQFIKIYSKEDIKNIMRFCRMYNRSKQSINSELIKFRINNHIYFYVKELIKSEKVFNNRRAVLDSLGSLLYNDIDNEIISKYVEKYRQEFPNEYNSYIESVKKLKEKYNNEIERINNDENLIRLWNKLPGKADGFEKTMNLYAKIYRKVRDADIVLSILSRKDGMTLGHLSEKYGITRQRVDEIATDEYEKMLNYFENLPKLKVKTYK